MVCFQHENKINIHNNFKAAKNAPLPEDDDDL